MKHFLRHISEINLPAGILLSVGCLSMWLPDIIGNPLWGDVLITFLLTLSNALLLSLINYRVRITHSVKALPMLCYLLISSSIPALHADWKSQIVVMLLQFIFLLLLRSYRKEHTAEEAFLSTLLLTVSALFMPDMLLLLPLLWSAFLLQGAMNLKSFLASCIAIAVTTLYVYLSTRIGWGYIADMTTIVARAKEPVINNLPLFLASILLSVTAVFTVICNFTTYQQERSIITTYLTCLQLPVLLCCIMLFLPPQHFPSLMAVAAYLTASTSTYFFCSRQSVFAGVGFLLFVVLYAGVGVVGWLLR